VFALVSTGDAPSSPELLKSVYLQSGAVRTGPKVTGGSFLVTYARTLYLVSPAAFDSSGDPGNAYLLRSVSLSGMGLGPSKALGNLGEYGEADTGSVSFQPSGRWAGDLWAGTNRRLELIDPGTGAVLRDVPLPRGQGYSVAVEPDGRFVDASVLTPAVSTQGQVIEVDTGTGVVVRRMTKIPSIGPPGLLAAPGGLWIFYRGGMAGTAIHVVEPSLAIDTPVVAANPDATEPMPGEYITMDEYPGLTGDVVLLTDSLGVACIAAAGTRVLASAPYPGGTWSSSGSTWAPFGSIGRTIYATATTAGGPTKESIIAVTPPSTCS
jgi:hypothetical protein